ncbi:MAG TPA: methyltransferase domain-containing protein [Acidimicrobiales bacterium]|jgi:ubiquinone/menaquinone biosynthesis C-methylase UbiE|nr:methyltransferase domain-containing protein [Acidimicrobiales bacterium]
METSFQSARGLQLSSVEWLLDHHRAKEKERRQMVDDLRLRPGDRVLDSASGPGLWSRLFAEKVHPGGRIVALDFSPELIEYARATLNKDPLGGVVDLVLGEFSLLPFDRGAFDAVFLGNCFCYVADAHTVLERHRQVTRPGGRVISKEFDGGAVVFHPVDPTLTLRVLTGAAQALADDAGPSRFDNFVGRKMHGMFQRAGFTAVSTRSYAIQKVSPLSPEAKRYISSNAEWYGRMALPYLSDDEQCRWADAFDSSSDACVLDRPDFYFSMIETVTEGIA